MADHDNISNAQNQGNDNLITVQFHDEEISNLQSINIFIMKNIINSHLIIYGILQSYFFNIDFIHEHNQNKTNVKHFKLVLNW